MESTPSVDSSIQEEAMAVKGGHVDPRKLVLKLALMEIRTQFDYLKMIGSRNDVICKIRNGFLYLLTS